MPAMAPIPATYTRGGRHIDYSGLPRTPIFRFDSGVIGHSASTRSRIVRALISSYRIYISIYSRTGLRRLHLLSRRLRVMYAGEELYELFLVRQRVRCALLGPAPPLPSRHAPALARAPRWRSGPHLSVYSRLGLIRRATSFRSGCLRAPSKTLQRHHSRLFSVASRSPLRRRHKTRLVSL